MPYLLPYQRRRRSNAFFCLATTALLCAVALTVLRPRLGLFLASLPFGAYLVPRSQWTRSRIALAFCTYGTCLLSGGLIQLSLRPHVVAVVPTPEAAAPEPHEKPPPPPRPAPVGSCSWMRARAPTATCEQHSHSRHSCSRQYVNVQEDGRLLSSPCVFNWSNPGFGRCEAAETRYECKKLGVSDTLLWNLLRAMLLIVFLTLVLPVLLPWLKAQMPSYGLMSNEAYERQCELTTEKELAKLRQHVQSRGMPATLSAHAQDRTRAFGDGLPAGGKVPASPFADMAPPASAGVAPKAQAAPTQDRARSLSSLEACLSVLPRWLFATVNHQVSRASAGAQQIGVERLPNSRPPAPAASSPHVAKLPLAPSRSLMSTEACRGPRAPPSAALRLMIPHPHPPHIRMDALRWMQHVLSPEKRAALDGFEIGEDGRRVDLDDDDVSLSEGSESDRE